MIPPVQPGQVVSRKYRLDRRLAEGGMGEVWVGRNERTQCDCAIKVLLPGLARNPEALRRFVQEARATGQLQHPGIVQIFDAGKTDDGRPYLVMELLAGENLAERLQRDVRVSPVETCVLISQVARAIHHAHLRRIVHRDLSSANVFLVRVADGGVPVPKILDFGVSKMADEASSGRYTLNGALLGSPAYMSPEQAQGAERVDARTDIWSLGVLLYQCLSGELPFSGRNHNATMLSIISRAHLSLGERMPELEPELGALVEGCLIKDREHRVQTALEVAETLERIARRLVRPGTDARFTPRRRLTDRMPQAPRHPSEQRMERDVRVMWWALGSGTGGALLGMLLGASLVLTGAEDRASARATGETAEGADGCPAGQLPGSAAEAQLEVTPVEPEAARAVAEPPKPNLARAVADGLGVDQR